MENLNKIQDEVAGEAGYGSFQLYLQELLTSGTVYAAERITKLTEEFAQRYAREDNKNTMTQEFKSIEEIKEEYASEHGRDTWEQYFQWLTLCHTDHDTMQGHYDQIAQRHSQQYIDANKELVEMLEYFVEANMLSVVGDELAKELINKCKKHE